MAGTRAVEKVGSLMMDRRSLTRLHRSPFSSAAVHFSSNLPHYPTNVLKRIWMVQERICIKRVLN